MLRLIPFDNIVFHRLDLLPSVPPFRGGVRVRLPVLAGAGFFLLSVVGHKCGWTGEVTSGSRVKVWAPKEPKTALPRPGVLMSQDQ